MDPGISTAMTRRADCGTFTGDVVVDALRSGSNAPPRDLPTERSQDTWSAGSYDRIAAGFRHEAEAFVTRLALVPGQHVLDAACGTGNLAIPAARTGARVTGLDLVSALVEIAAGWAERERLAIRFDTGNVESLPYVDGRFDVVMSMFGTMFAARPDCVVAELARVTRPGGRVALANWTREGFVGKLLATHVAYLPAPVGVPGPLLWGDEHVVRERFSERHWKVSTRLRTLTFRYPHTPRGTAELFRTAYGPTVRTFLALDEDRRARFAADLAELWSRDQWPQATETVVDAEYLEVVAVRR
jgi:SAM-dependent methyltransferase